MQLIMTARFEPRGSKPIDVPIYEHEGSKWISGTVVALCLGYSRDTFKNLWKRNKDTLARHSTVHMMPAKALGGERATRVFTLKGARIVAARCQSRMENALDFITWLDKIEHIEVVNKPSLLQRLREWWRARHV